MARRIQGSVEEQTVDLWRANSKAPSPLRGFVELAKWVALAAALPAPQEQPYAALLRHR